MSDIKTSNSQQQPMDVDKFAEVLSRNGLEEYTFFNEPVQVDKADYERLIGDITRQSRRLAGLLGVYLDDDERGGQISPKRLIAVYDEETCDARNQKFDEVLKVVGTRNIVESEFLSVDRHLLQNLKRFDCLLQPRRLYGQDIVPTLPRESEIRFFNISRIQDLLTTGYLAPFYVAEVERQVDTQVILSRMVEFARLIQLTKEILRRNEVKHWDKLLDDIEIICQNWFNMGLERYRLLMDLVRNTFYVLFEIIGEMNAFFERAQVVNMKLEEGREPYRALIATESFVTVFSEDWTPHRALEMMIHLKENCGKFTTVLPVAFAMQLVEYTKGNSSFCSYIKSCFKTVGLTGNMERSYISWERGKLLNHYRNLLTTLGIDKVGRVVFDCNLKSGGAFHKASNIMNIKKNKSLLKNVSKILG
jgi:hypothetical protein